MDDGANRKLQGIQALRGVAAVAVILYHVSRHIDQAIGAPLLAAMSRPGHAGVDLFFVLSGFIILSVHGTDIGRPERLGRYARQRFIRVMPLFWIAMAATVAMMLAGGHAIAIGWLLWSAALLPTSTDPLLGVAWTLEHEAIFYVFFALLIVSRRAGLIAMGAWFAASLAAPWDANPLPALPRIASMYNLQFLLGMGAAAMVASGRLRAPGVLACGGAALLLAACAGEAIGVLDGYGPMARIAYGLPSALLIGGLAGWERQRSLPVPAMLVALGEASYSLYLFQFIALGIAWQLWRVAGLDTAAWWPLCMLWLLAAAVAGGVIVSRTIEMPLLRRLRGRSAARTPAAVPARHAS